MGPAPMIMMDLRSVRFLSTPIAACHGSTAFSATALSALDRRAAARGRPNAPRGTPAAECGAGAGPWRRGAAAAARPTFSGPLLPAAAAAAPPAVGRCARCWTFIFETLSVVGRRAGAARRAARRGRGWGVSLLQLTASGHPGSPRATAARAGGRSEFGYWFLPLSTLACRRGAPNASTGWQRRCRRLRRLRRRRGPSKGGPSAQPLRRAAAAAAAGGRGARSEG